ncbi:MAG: hypothetical protein HY842_10985 [Bacteroidetes bacterium]|nr:hypothetical protein [Bacteroidota bacterium]
MKKLLSTLTICACSCIVLAQGIKLGTYEGTGTVQNIACPVKFRFERSGVAVTYGGICSCVSLLQTTGTKLLYKEIDVLSSDGGIRNDSCRKRDFVFFTQKNGNLTACWGSTAEEALANKSPVLLVKTK